MFYNESPFILSYKVNYSNQKVLKFVNQSNSQNQWFSFTKMSKDRFFLSYKDHFSFLINRKKHLVNIYLKNNSLLQSPSLKHYIQTQIKSFVLCLEGKEPLHGTVLTYKKKTFCFLGDSGVGKSTLAAYLMSHGFKLACDDLVQVDPKGDLLCPKNLYIKLYPKISKLYKPKGRKLGALNSKTKKEIWQIKQNFKKLKIDYFVKIEHKSKKIQATRTTGAEAFFELQSSVFNVSYIESARLKNSLQQLAELATNVPCYKLNYPKKLTSLNDCKSLLLKILNGPHLNNMIL